MIMRYRSITLFERAAFDTVPPLGRIAKGGTPFHTLCCIYI